MAHLAHYHLPVHEPDSIITNSPASVTMRLANSLVSLRLPSQYDFQVFGLPILDLFFCSRAFASVLQQAGVRVTLVELSSKNCDHWRVLSSGAPLVLFCLPCPSSSCSSQSSQNNGMLYRKLPVVAPLSVSQLCT